MVTFKSNLSRRRKQLCVQQGTVILLLCALKIRHIKLSIYLLLHISKYSAIHYNAFLDRS